MLLDEFEEPFPFGILPAVRWNFLRKTCNRKNVARPNLESGDEPALVVVLYRPNSCKFAIRGRVLRWWSPSINPVDLPDLPNDRVYILTGALYRCKEIVTRLE